MDTYYEIKNPTQEDCYFIYKGQKYSVEPMGTTKNVPEEVAIEWVGTVHQFLKKSKQTSIKVEATKVEETVEEVVIDTAPEVAEEVKEEVIVEAPKSSKK